MGHDAHATVQPLPPEQLVRRLLSTPLGGLCLLTAPAGYGCTTLLTAVVERAGCPVAWVALAARDGKRPERFWRRLVNALGAAGVDVAEARATLLAAEQVQAVAVERGRKHPRQDIYEPLATALLAAMADVDGLVVVIDDLDARRHQRLAGHLMQLLEGQPATCRIFVRARHGSQLPLAHLLSSGRLVLVDADALTLTPAQARTVVSGIAPHMTPAARDALVVLAGGWLAALAGAARVAAAEPDDDPSAWLMGAGLDLLFAAELAHLRDDERELLVSTCVLGELSAPACDAVTGRTDSHRVLARLAAGEIMIRRVAGSPPRYRLHPLFAEYLRRCLEDRGPGAGASAHAAAAEWSLQEGDLDAALTHLVDSGNSGGALDLLTGRLEPLMQSGRSEIVRRLYAAAMPTLLTDSELHMMGATWAELLTGNLAGAEQHLRVLDDVIADLRERSHDLSEQETRKREWLTAETEFTHVVIEAWRGYPARAAQRNDRARALFGDSWTRFVEQSAAFMSVRLHLWHGDVAAARTELVAAARRPRTREYHRSLTVPALWAGVAALEGRVRRGRYLAEEVLRRCESREVLRGFMEAEARLALAACLTDLDLLDDAEQQARTVLLAAVEARDSSHEVLARLRLCAVAAARPDRSTAADLVADVRAVLTARCPGSDLAGIVDAVEARLWLDSGDHDRTRHLLGRLPDGPDRQLIAARLDRRRTVHDALRVAHRIRAQTPRQKVELRLLLASCYAPSRPAEAATHLVAAVDAANELGLLRALVGWPEEVQVLAERTALEQSSRALTQLLQVARRPEPIAPAEPAAAQRAVSPLSAGEMEILRALTTSPGRAHVDLAAELGISVNTLKTRLRRLYAKLGVHGRDEAVGRAREVGLIDGSVAG